jgi:hypothetical protein
MKKIKIKTGKSYKYFGVLEVDDNTSASYLQLNNFAVFNAIWIFREFCVKELLLALFKSYAKYVWVVIAAGSLSRIFWQFFFFNLSPWKLEFFNIIFNGKLK